MSVLRSFFRECVVPVVVLILGLAGLALVLIVVSHFLGPRPQSVVKCPACGADLELVKKEK